MNTCFPQLFFYFAKPSYLHIHIDFRHSIALYHPVVLFYVSILVSALLLDPSPRAAKGMGPHPYHTRSKARQAFSPAPDLTDSQMRSHCASPPTFSPASSNGDARVRSHSVAPPISKPDSLIKDFHMHSGSANPPMLKSDSLDGDFHVHSRIASPPTSKPNTLNEIFHMHSYSAILPTSNPASPDEDAQRRSHSSSRSEFDTASFGDNVHELTPNYFGPTRWSEFLRSHSPVSCPYLCEHWPYMAATHDRYIPYSGEDLHLLEPRETAKKHTKTPDDLDQASITSDDQTTEEDWRPSSRDYSVRNAKEDPIPWAEWTNLPSSLENSPTQTPLENLPLVAPYRRSGPLHLDNDRIQEHSATMSSQRPKARSWAYCLDPQNPTSTANQQLGSEPRPLDVKEALYLVCSTKAQRQAPESTFALRASSKNPFMGHDFPYLDDGFNEFAKSSLNSTLELPYRYGPVSWQPDSAVSNDVFTQSGQQELANWFATWQVSFPKLGAFNPSMRPLTLEQEIHRITYELKVERTYILYTRVLIHLVRGR